MGNTASIPCLKHDPSKRQLADNQPNAAATGMNSLPAETWQTILDAIPFEHLWSCRGVCHAWNTYIEQHLPERLLQDTRLINLYPTHPSDPVDDTSPYYTRYRPAWESCEDRWLVYMRPGSCPRPRFRRTIKFKVGVRLSDYRMLPVTVRVRYEKASDEIYIDWRVLLAAMFTARRISHWRDDAEEFEIQENDWIRRLSLKAWVKRLRS